jgi:hypothetical protein
VATPSSFIRRLVFHLDQAFDRALLSDAAEELLDHLLVVHATNELLPVRRSLTECCTHLLPPLRHAHRFALEAAIP